MLFYMSMEHWRLGQEAKGNAAAVKYAELGLELFGDVPLPSHETTPVEVKRFSPEAREKLEKAGYLIDQIGGNSIKSLRDNGRRFWSTWHNSYPDLEALTSSYTEVAINPDQLFLPDSNSKTLSQQEAMVAKFSKELAKKIPGVQAIIGEMPDYVELAFNHQAKTGDYLFGQKYDYNYARTKTPTSGSFVADVGYFRSDDGLRVDDWHADRGLSDVFAAPLVVPSGK